VSLTLDVDPRFGINLGMDNVFDRKPPLGLLGIGGGSSIYDTRGRFFYAGITAKF
jgi:outer membrane receptor protein involved in Fe transport